MKIARLLTDAEFAARKLAHRLALGQLSARVAVYRIQNDKLAHLHAIRARAGR